MSDISTIQSHLAHLYKDQRIVFWHDAEREYVDTIDMIELPDVVVLIVGNNEYGLKYRMLEQESKSKFLVYRAGSAPEDTDNWFLDLELAFGTFSADRPSLIQQELGIEGADLRQVIAAHAAFFSSSKRTNKLKALLDPSDNSRQVRAKMIAVLLGQRGHTMLEITRTLLRENAQGENARHDLIAETGYDLIPEFGLAEFHWEGAATIYGYASNNPSVDDFVLWVFQNAMTGFHSEIPGALRNIQLDFSNLRYDSRFASAYAALARRAAHDLDIESKIGDTDFRDLLDNDLFEVIDQKIISDLAQGVANRTLFAKDVTEWVRRRQSSPWITGFKNLYAAIDAAAALLADIDALSTSMGSFDDGLNKYTSRWFRIDQFYRQFTLHVRLAEYSGLLEQLRKQVEAFYSNRFLYILGSAWQKQVDAVRTWQSASVPSQTAFFDHHVRPVLSGGRNKVVVIISDALRYEIADELKSRIRQEDRFDAELKYMLGVLPSYTQLGMAALLPHESLGHTEATDLVKVDGKPTGGIANRNKILEKVHGQAIQAEDFLALNREEARGLFRQHQVLYVYHNRIDATGDKPTTEGQVFEAAEKSVQEIIEIIKKLTNANATNVLVTADHGFLFQDGGLDEAGYLSVAPQADQIVVQARRYVLGRGLKDDSAFKTFTPAQLGLDSDLELQIPKSIHRLRLSGSGSRFVHGGASLQEIVVPVLTINKMRKSDIRQVLVEILPESGFITTGQIAVRLFQVEPVTDKVQPRTLRAGLYIGELLISNLVELTFDHASDDKRDRYVTANLLLSNEANDYNNRAVEFRLDEPIAKTNQRRTYAKFTYTLKRSFATDF